MRRCKRQEQKWYYPFCLDHRWQPFFLLISIGTGLIFVSDLAESLGLKKPIEYVKTEGTSNQNNEVSKTLAVSEDSTYYVLLLPFTADSKCMLENVQYHSQIQRRIEEINRLEKLRLEVHRQDTIMCDLLNTDSVRAYGEKLGANLIVYGRYQEQCEWDSTLLNIQYILMDSMRNRYPFSVEDESKYSVFDNQSLLELRSGKFTGRVENVLYWALGIREYDRKMYQKSLEYLERISFPVLGRKHSIFFKFLGDNKDILGKPESAIKDYNLAIKLDPTYTAAYNNRGLAKSNLGRNKAAIKDYDLAIKLDPRYPYAYNNRGNAESGIGNYKAAIDDYDMAIKLNPKYAIAYNNRGLAKSDLGRYKAAILDYDLAIQLDSTLFIAHNNRRSAFEKLRKGDSRD